RHGDCIVSLARGGAAGTEWAGVLLIFVFFNDAATTEIYTLSLHDALLIWHRNGRFDHLRPAQMAYDACRLRALPDEASRPLAGILSRGQQLHARDGSRTHAARPLRAVVAMDPPFQRAQALHDAGLDRLEIGS